MNFTIYQRIILSIYFIVGLPMIWIVPVLWLMRRYLFEDKEFLKPENRQTLIIEACSWMVTSTIFVGGIYSLVRCAGSP